MTDFLAQKCQARASAMSENAIRNHLAQMSGWREADAFASKHASGPELASALLKLHEDNASTLTPDPLYARFYYSHPPAVERLAALVVRPSEPISP